MKKSALKEAIKSLLKEGFPQLKEYTSEEFKTLLEKEISNWNPTKVGGRRSTRPVDEYTTAGWEEWMEIMFSDLRHKNE